MRAEMATLAMEMTGYSGDSLRKMIQSERAHCKPIAEASGFRGD